MEKTGKFTSLERFCLELPSKTFILGGSFKIEGQDHVFKGAVNFYPRRTEEGLTNFIRRTMTNNILKVKSRLIAETILAASGAYELKKTGGWILRAKTEVLITLPSITVEINHRELPKIKIEELHLSLKPISD